MGQLTENKPCILCQKEHATEFHRQFDIEQPKKEATNMKKIVITMAFILFGITSGFCEVKYINGYSRSDGTYVSGHYRDTSNDGNPYNNANTLGYNGYRRVPDGIYGN